MNDETRKRWSYRLLLVYNVEERPGQEKQSCVEREASRSDPKTGRAVQSSDGTPFPLPFPPLPGTGWTGNLMPCSRGTGRIKIR